MRQAVFVRRGRVHSGLIQRHGLQLTQGTTQRNSRQSPGEHISSSAQGPQLAQLRRTAGHDDAKFIFLWIAFNSVYAHEVEDRSRFRERRVLLNFLHLLNEVDDDKLFYGIVWDEFPNSIRLLLANKYVFQPFWDFQCDKIPEEEWLKHFSNSKNAAQRALGKMDTVKVLAIVFCELADRIDSGFHNETLISSSS